MLLKYFTLFRIITLIIKRLRVMDVCALPEHIVSEVMFSMEIRKKQKTTIYLQGKSVWSTAINLHCRIRSLFIS